MVGPKSIILSEEVMGKFYVYSSRASKGARALAKALKGVRVKTIPPLAPGDTLINWGDSKCNLFNQTFNSGQLVRTIANKLTAFDAFSSANVPIPAYARRKEDVTWQGLTVVRHKLTGHSGEGIELCDASDLPDAPLYVRYIKKEDEYRIHVGRNGDTSIRVIAVQRKARRKDTPDANVNWKVRNHQNGFVFVRHDVSAPERVIAAAIDALACSGLDFGAVDVIYNRKEGKAYVLEINTAPGLEGQTIADYAAFFRGDTE
jgi:glutathione synthase/RimK-type ligase-like ATP-grasp enzyme